MGIPAARGCGRTGEVETSIEKDKLDSVTLQKYLILPKKVLHTCHINSIIRLSFPSEGMRSSQCYSDDQK